MKNLNIKIKNIVFSIIPASGFFENIEIQGTLWLNSPQIYVKHKYFCIIERNNRLYVAKHNKWFYCGVAAKSR